MNECVAQRRLLFNLDSTQRPIHLDKYECHAAGNRAGVRSLFACSNQLVLDEELVRAERVERPRRLGFGYKGMVSSRMLLRNLTRGCGRFRLLPGRPRFQYMTGQAPLIEAGLVFRSVGSNSEQQNVSIM